MSAKQYMRGHEIHYDDEKKAWIYTENSERVYDIKLPRLMEAVDF